MANDFEGQVVVVTGASEGIGAALAEEVATRGAKVVLTARRKEKLEEVAKRLGPDALAVAGDMTRREDVQRMLAAALERFHQVDIWVNNAGRGISRPVLELTDGDVDSMMRDNLKSALYAMQAVVPHFKARNAGVLANVSSMLSRMPFAFQRSAYSASKAALNSLTESLRFELGQAHPGIRIVLVLPGIVATGFGQNALGGGVDSRQLPGAQDVKEVARVIADGLRQGPLDLYSRPGYYDQALAHLQTLHDA